MYLLFGGTYETPEGGADDFFGSAETLEDCKKLLASHDRRWAHVAELRDGKLVVIEDYRYDDHYHGDKMHPYGWYHWSNRAERRKAERQFEVDALKRHLKELGE